MHGFSFFRVRHTCYQLNFRRCLVNCRQFFSVFPDYQYNFELTDIPAFLQMTPYHRKNLSIIHSFGKNQYFCYSRCISYCCMSYHKNISFINSSYSFIRRTASLNWAFPKSFHVLYHIPFSNQAIVPN